MSFLAPLFLAGAAAAAVPLVLHLLKREPEPRVRFGPVKLLKKAPVELTEKRKLRELLLLALRVAALLLLAVAFARPFVASGAAVDSAGATLVAIDTSYSMSGSPGRMERARQLARDAVIHAPAGNLVGVLAFADAAEIVAPPSVDRGLALSAIDGTTAGFGATRYRVGLHAAARALRGRHGAIVVVTDLQESGWDAGDRASVPQSLRIDVADVGPPPENLAVTSIRVGDGRVVASVRNTGGRARETRVRVAFDGQPAGDRPLTVSPNASAEVTLPARSGVGTAEVAIDDADGLQADNVRYAVLDNTRQSLLVVTATGDLPREAFYVQQALAAAAATGVPYQVAGASGAQLSAWAAARLSSETAVLLLSTRGLERRARETLAAYARGGGGLVIAAGPDVDGEVIADVAGADSALRIAASPDAAPSTRALAPGDLRHPIFQSFGANAASLGLVTFRTVARIGGAGCQAIARFTSGEAALIDCPVGDGHALVMASDLNNRWNDFPLHATFVPFLHEAVRYLASGRTLADDYLVGEAPDGVPRKPGITTIGADIRPGISGSSSAHPRRVAINVDPREGDPARLSVDEFQSAVAHLKDAGTSEAHVEAVRQEDRQQMWRVALMLMVALLAIEGVVASRTA